MVEAIRKISIYTHTERSQMESTSHIYFTTQQKQTNNQKQKQKQTKKLHTKPQKPFVRDKFQIRKFKNYQVSFSYEIQRPKTSFQSRSK